MPVVHEGEGHDDDERREVLRVEHKVVSLKEDILKKLRWIFLAGNSNSYLDEVAEVARQQRSALLLLEGLQRRLELVVGVGLALQVALDLAQLFACNAIQGTDDVTAGPDCKVHSQLTLGATAT